MYVSRVLSSDAMNSDYWYSARSACIVLFLIQASNVDFLSILFKIIITVYIQIYINW